MRPHIPFILILFFAMVLLIGSFSCKKKTSAPGQYTAYINGTAHSYTKDQQMLAYDNTYFTELTGTDPGTGDVLTILLSGDTLGTYTTGFLINTNTVSFIHNGISYETFFGNTPGHVILNSVNKTSKSASGTFSCTVYNQNNSHDSVNITSGSFSVPISN